MAVGVKPRCLGGGVDGGSIWPLGGRAAGVGDDFMYNSSWAPSSLDSKVPPPFLSALVLLRVRRRLPMGGVLGGDDRAAVTAKEWGGEEVVIVFVGGGKVRSV